MPLTSTTPASGGRITADFGNEVAMSSYRGDASDNATQITLTTVAAALAGAVSVTFTLTKTRRVRISTRARYVLGSTTLGRTTVQGGYNTGASVVIGSVTLLSTPGSIVNNSSTAGSSGAMSGDHEGTVLLAAGTYTAYPVVTRQNGGSASDYCVGFYVVVDDVGAS